MCPARKNRSGEDPAFSWQQRNLIKQVALLGNPNKCAHICVPYMPYASNVVSLLGEELFPSMTFPRNGVWWFILSWTAISLGLMDNVDVTAAPAEEADKLKLGSNEPQALVMEGLLILQCLTYTLINLILRKV